VVSCTAAGSVTDEGPLTVERMKTVDEEVLGKSLAYLDACAKDGQPFFLWHNPSRLHVLIQLKDDRKGISLTRVRRGGKPDAKRVTSRLDGRIAENDVTRTTPCLVRQRVMFKHDAVTIEGCHAIGTLVFAASAVSFFGNLMLA
jgi:hypothetical protein